MNCKSLAKQIDALVRFEGRCAKFYLKLARIFRRAPELRDLWRSMAEDERLHRDLLDRIKRSLIAQGHKHEPIDVDEQRLLETIEDCERRLNKELSVDDAFDLVVRIESIEFGEIIEKLTSRPDLSSLAWAAKAVPSEEGHLGSLMMAADEFCQDKGVRAHLKSLINLRLRVSKKQKEIEGLRRQLEQKESYLLNVLDNTLDAIIWIDNDHVIRSWNKGAEQIFGYAPEEIIGRSFQTLLPERLRRAGELDKILHEVKLHGSIRNYQTERVTKDGRTIIVDLTSTAIKDENGKMIGRVAFLRDITRDKQLERERELVRERLFKAEKLAEIGQLAAGVAHELRNPLAAIKGAIQVLKESCMDSEAHSQVMDEIIQRVDRLNAIVRDLLEYAKPMPPNKVHIKLTEVLDSAIAALNTDPQLSKVQVQKEYLSDAMAWADPNLIERVFINIILNAAQAMKFSGILRIKAEERDGYALISFTDTGPGIDEMILEKIFDPFFTTKPEGSGLGLSLCKKYVDAHDGKIEVKSEPSKGTTFTVMLPQAPLR